MILSLLSSFVLSYQSSNTLLNEVANRSIGDLPQQEHPSSLNAGKNDPYMIMTTMMTMMAHYLEWGACAVWSSVFLPLVDVALSWPLAFPLACAVLLWISVGLSILGTLELGHRRRIKREKRLTIFVQSAPVSRRLAFSCPTNHNSSHPNPLPSRPSSTITDNTTPYRTSPPTTTTTPTPSSRHFFSSSSVNDDFFSLSLSPESTDCPPTLSCTSPSSPRKFSSGGVIECHRIRVPPTTRMVLKPISHRCVVVVGGDFARSPRMQYHATSLAQSGFFDQVSLVGFSEGNALSEALLHAGERKKHPSSTKNRAKVGKVDEKKKKKRGVNEKEEKEVDEEVEDEGEEEYTVWNDRIWRVFVEDSISPSPSMGNEPTLNKQKTQERLFEQQQEGNDQEKTIPDQRKNSDTDLISGDPPSLFMEVPQGRGNNQAPRKKGSRGNDGDEDSPEGRYPPCEEGMAFSSGEVEPFSSSTFIANMNVLADLPEKSSLHSPSSSSSLKEVRRVRFVKPLFLPTSSVSSSPSDAASAHIGAAAKDPHFRAYREEQGCFVCTSYLVPSPQPPHWLLRLFSLFPGPWSRKAMWLCSAVYRTLYMIYIFFSLLMRAMVIRINANGQLEVTSCVFFQTPPCIPILIVANYLVRPLAMLYNLFFYYGLIFPTSLVTKKDFHGVLFTRSPIITSFVEAEESREKEEKENESGGPSHTHHPTASGQHTNTNSKSTRKSNKAMPNYVKGGLPVSSSTLPPSLLGKKRRSWIHPFFRPMFVVDWHNYGFTLLEDCTCPRPVKQLYRRLELQCCAGDINLTVSRAMQRSLLKLIISPSSTQKKSNPESSPSSFRLASHWLTGGTPQVKLCSGLQQTSCSRSPSSRLSLTSSTEKCHRSESKKSTRVSTKDERVRPSSSIHTPNVYVLYDVAPAFFAPASRESLLKKVIFPLSGCHFPRVPFTESPPSSSSLSSSSSGSPLLTPDNRGAPAFPAPTNVTGSCPTNSGSPLPRTLISAFCTARRASAMTSTDTINHPNRNDENDNNAYLLRNSFISICAPSVLTSDNPRRAVRDAEVDAPDHDDNEDEKRLFQRSASSSSSSFPNRRISHGDHRAKENIIEEEGEASEEDRSRGKTASMEEGNLYEAVPETKLKKNMFNYAVPHNDVEMAEGLSSSSVKAEGRKERRESKGDGNRLEERKCTPLSNEGCSRKNTMDGQGKHLRKEHEGEVIEEDMDMNVIRNSEKSDLSGRKDVEDVHRSRRERHKEDTRGAEQLVHAEDGREMKHGEMSVPNRRHEGTSKGNKESSRHHHRSKTRKRKQVASLSVNKESGSEKSTERHGKQICAQEGWGIAPPPDWVFEEFDEMKRPSYRRCHHHHLHSHSHFFPFYCREVQDAGEEEKKGKGTGRSEKKKKDISYKSPSSRHSKPKQVEGWRKNKEGTPSMPGNEDLIEKELKKTHSFSFLSSSSSSSLDVSGAGYGARSSHSDSPHPHSLERTPFHLPRSCRNRKGLIVVGSTSWTPDDDYSILVEALQRLDYRLCHQEREIDKVTAGAHYVPYSFSHWHPSSVPPPPPSGMRWGSHPVITPSEGGNLLEVGGNRSPVSPSALIHHSSSLSGQAAGEGTSGTTSSHHCTPSSSSGFLDVWVLITGKGRARAKFEEQVRAASLSSHVVVSTVYLQSFQQYSITLGAADVGLCLHKSSSGLDLPMKGVDMLGAGLPVMALDYEAIEELLGGGLEEDKEEMEVENWSVASHPNNLKEKKQRRKGKDSKRREVKPTPPSTAHSRDSRDKKAEGRTNRQVSASHRNGLSLGEEGAVKGKEPHFSPFANGASVSFSSTKTTHTSPTESGLLRENEESWGGDVLSEIRRTPSPPYSLSSPSSRGSPSLRSCSSSSSSSASCSSSFASLRLPSLPGRTIKTFPYGWSFQTAEDLEELLSMFVGLPPLSSSSLVPAMARGKTNTGPCYFSSSTPRFGSSSASQDLPPSLWPHSSIPSPTRSSPTHSVSSFPPISSHYYWKMPSRQFWDSSSASTREGTSLFHRSLQDYPGSCASSSSLNHYHRRHHQYYARPEARVERSCSGGRLSQRFDAIQRDAETGTVFSSSSCCFWPWLWSPYLVTTRYRVQQRRGPRNERNRKGAKFGQSFSSRHYDPQRHCSRSVEKSTHNTLMRSLEEEGASTLDSGQSRRKWEAEVNNHRHLRHHGNDPSADPHTGTWDDQWTKVVEPLLEELMDAIHFPYFVSL